MANGVLQALVFTISALFLVSSALASSDAPFIVAHKKAILTRLKSGSERVSVSIDIYNQGTTTAYDISLSDDSWPQDSFAIVSGNTSMYWEKLNAGDLVSHSFELEAKVKGPFYGAPAVITFRIPNKNALLEAYSSPILPLDVLADRPAQKKLDLAKRLLANYGSQVSVIGIVVLFVYLLSSPPNSSGAKGSKKRR